jgi:hypothetical protein
MESRLGWGGVLLLLLAHGWRHHTWQLQCRWGGACAAVFVLSYGCPRTHEAIPNTVVGQHMQQFCSHVCIVVCFMMEKTNSPMCA